MDDDRRERSNFEGIWWPRAKLSLSNYRDYKEICFATNRIRTTDTRDTGETYAKASLVGGQQIKKI